MLIGKARTADVIDAALVLLTENGDSLLTSDPRDLAALAAIAGVEVDVVRV
jgi:hypothetical protein